MLIRKYAGGKSARHIFQTVIGCSPGIYVAGKFGGKRERFEKRIAPENYSQRKFSGAILFLR